MTAVSPGDDGMDIWLEAVNSFFCGDSELVEYVQQIVGLAAIGKVYMEALIISYGEGRNGKSTFWNTLLSTHYRKSIVSYAVTPLTESELSVNGWRKGIPLDPELDSRFSAAFHRSRLRSVCP